MISLCLLCTWVLVYTLHKHDPAIKTIVSFPRPFPPFPCSVGIGPFICGEEMEIRPCQQSSLKTTQLWSVMCYLVNGISYCRKVRCWKVWTLHTTSQWVFSTDWKLSLLNSCVIPMIFSKLLRQNYNTENWSRSRHFLSLDMVDV